MAEENKQKTRRRVVLIRIHRWKYNGIMQKCLTFSLLPRPWKLQMKLARQKEVSAECQNPNKCGIQPICLNLPIKVLWASSDPIRRILWMRMTSLKLGQADLTAISTKQGVEVDGCVEWRGCWEGGEWKASIVTLRATEGENGEEGSNRGGGECLKKTTELRVMNPERSADMSFIFRQSSHRSFIIVI